MLLSNQDERVQAALYEITDRVGHFVRTYAHYDQALIDQVETIIEDHAQGFKARTGYDFPPLCIFSLPSVGVIICTRKDLEPDEIRCRLLEWLRMLRRHGLLVSAIEVASAVRCCWPHYTAPIEDLRRDRKLEKTLQ